MSATAVYFGEASGNRIFFYAGQNLGIFPFLPSLWTWDVTPAGEAGVIVARAVHWTINASNGFNLSLTPYFDGNAGLPSFFNGSTVGETKLEAQFTPPVRCSRVSVQLQLLSLTGDIQLRNAKLIHTPLREFPAG